jgi:hypothetical protein
MARPIIVDESLFISPAAFDLLTGERLPHYVPTGRCGAVCASSGAMFYRWNGVITMWDVSSGKADGWSRLRPGCWLSVVPANGMLLSPEAGGGCWCSIWLETSLGFTPPDYPRPKFDPEQREFVGSMVVKLVSQREGGTIRYTLDGSYPTTESTAYTEPIVIRDDTTIMAKTFWTQEGDVVPVASDVAAAEFRRLYPPPEFASKVNLFADPKKIEILKEDPEGQIYYTLDGSEPTEQSLLYKEPFTIDDTTTIKAGIFYRSGKKSPVVTATYTKTEALHYDGLTLIPGLEYEYYEDWWSTMPDFDKLKPVVTGRIGSITIDLRKRDDGFGIRYHGYINVPQDGEYKFFLRSDDGSRLYIDDKLVIDNDGIHDHNATKEAKLTLKAGPHPITVTYFECASFQFLELSYEGPGVERQVVPASALYSPQ